MNSLLLLAALTGTSPQPAVVPDAGTASSAVQDDDAWRKIRAERMTDVLTAISKDEPIDRDDAVWALSEINTELAPEKLYQTRRRVFEKALGTIKAKGMYIQDKEILPPNAPDKEAARLAAVVANAVVDRYERDLKETKTVVQRAKLKPEPKK